MSVFVKQRREDRQNTIVNVCVRQLSAMILPAIVMALNHNYNSSVMLVWILLIAGVTLINGWYLLTETKDYYIDEVGVAEFGFFGKVKLKQHPWSEFIFVGALNLKARFRGEYEGLAVVCSTLVPKMRFSNSTQYVLGHKGVLKFEYDPELYETIMKLKNASANGDGTQC